MAQRTRSSIACARCKSTKTKCSDYRPCKHCSYLRIACQEVHKAEQHRSVHMQPIKNEPLLDCAPSTTRHVPFFDRKSSSSNWENSTEFNRSLPSSQLRGLVSSFSSFSYSQECRASSTMTQYNLPSPQLPFDFNTNQAIRSPSHLNPQCNTFPTGQLSGASTSHAMPFLALPPPAAGLLLPPITFAIPPAPALPPATALRLLLSLEFSGAKLRAGDVGGAWAAPRRFE